MGKWITSIVALIFFFAFCWCIRSAMLGATTQHATDKSNQVVSEDSVINKEVTTPGKQKSDDSSTKSPVQIPDNSKYNMPPPPEAAGGTNNSPQLPSSFLSSKDFQRGLSDGYKDGYNCLPRQSGGGRSSKYIIGYGTGYQDGQRDQDKIKKWE